MCDRVEFSELSLFPSRMKWWCANATPVGSLCAKQRRGKRDTGGGQYSKQRRTGRQAVFQFQIEIQCKRWASCTGRETGEKKRILGVGGWTELQEREDTQPPFSVRQRWGKRGTKQARMLSVFLLLHLLLVLLVKGMTVYGKLWSVMSTTWAKDLAPGTKYHT